MRVDSSRNVGIEMRYRGTVHRWPYWETGPFGERTLMTIADHRRLVDDSRFLH